jgi:RsiW-degrading membrane proteinase PrsW (M82 family)
VVKLANDPERTRRTVGTVLYVLAMLGGALLFVLVFVVAPLFELSDPGSYFGAMLMGAVMALPALGAYIWIPRIVDRYDPEPWWLLLGALGWGGIASCGFAAVINTAVGEVGEAAFGGGAGEVLAACVSAPIVEEGFKGLGVFGIYYFVRREFDGVVDGVIYAMFIALGFAAIENVIYYSRAVSTEMATTGAGGALGVTFFVRGIVSPWGHPLFTSMTGIGFGIARETDKPHLRWLAPMGGYAAAVFLHSVWNTAGTIHAALVLVLLPLWIAAVVGFGFLLNWLVKRKGRIIRAFLQDEVLLGFLTPWELDLVSSRTPRMRANALYGGEAGKRFVDTASRLALSKWHAQRASRGRQKTVSFDLVVPLRQELAQTRAQIAQILRRPIEQPRPFQPGGPPPAWMQPIPQWVYRR